MRFFLLFLFACGVVACGKNSDASGPTVRSKCLSIDVPAETEVHILGAYEGGDKNGIEEPVYDVIPGKVTLIASGDAAPGLYVVSAYEEVTWDFSNVPANRLLGIIAYGYEKQTVINAPDGIPLAYGALRERSGKFIAPTRPECGGNLFAYKGGPDLDALVDQVEKATGLKVTIFHGEYAPKTIDLDKVITSNKDVGRRSSIEINHREQGADRLERFTQGGYIRLANQLDIDTWNAAGTLRLKSGHLAPFVSERLRLGDTYVVLKPWNIPEEMAGAYSRSFIVPPGVQVPKDLSGHNDFYLMEDGSCLGAGADCKL